MGWAEFFRTAPTLPGAAPRMVGTAAEEKKPLSQFSRSSASQPAASTEHAQQQQSQGVNPASEEKGKRTETAESLGSGPAIHSAAGEDFVVPPAGFIQPLYISKVNTVFQLGLIAGCILHSWYGWPSEEVLWGLGGVTAVATLASFAAYVQVYRRGAMQDKT